MDILYETFVATDLSNALCAPGLILAITFGLVSIAIAIDSDVTGNKTVLPVFVCLSAIGIMLFVSGMNIPKVRQVYALPEEGFCYVDYADNYDLVEQKGRILIMNKKN